MSRGSHAGHIPLEDGRPLLPGVELDERTSTGEGLRLIPLETRDRRGYRSDHEGIHPPWRKDAYRDPERDES